MTISDKQIEELERLRERALQCKGTPGEKEAAFDYGSTALIALPDLLSEVKQARSQRAAAREVIRGVRIELNEIDEIDNVIRSIAEADTKEAIISALAAVPLISNKQK